MSSKIYSYEEAFQNSLKYFNGDDLAASAFLSKYALRNNKDELLEDTPEKMHRRLAKEFARVQKSKYKNNALTEDQIFSLLDGFKKIIPQGSPMFGIGNNYQIVSISNCFVLDVPEDSYNSILDVDKQLVNISKRRGGVGIDLSKLRPKGAVTNNAARSSTGIVSWMERYSNSIREVGQAGRRGALMLTLSVHHPDVLDFATIKNDDTKVTGANISLRLTKEFLDAVEQDKEYELRFPVDSKTPTISKLVSARKVWETIIHSAWLRAEPGLVMWDNVLKGPADCYEEYKSVTCNPCSEIFMPPLESCRLLAINLFGYVKNPFTKDAYFDVKEFDNDVNIAQRLMDDVVDLESEKIDQILAKIKNDPEHPKVKEDEIDLWTRIKKLNDECRRTGLGITALGDTLAALGIKYGSEKSIEVAEKIYKTLKLSAYNASVQMAEELGQFLDYDPKVEENNEFIQRIKEDDAFLYKRMVQKGRRNIALTTTAPTGTVSIMAQTSSGIEPVFNLSYKRRKKINPNDKNARIDFTDQNGDNWQEYDVYHPKLKMWMEVTGETDIKNSPWYGATANDIDWINRVKLQAAAQKHVCHAISSTINLPETVTEQKVAEIYETAFKMGLKGITVYRDNCRSGVLVNKTETPKKAQIQKTTAPKRPHELPCDVHHVNFKGKRYYVVVGMLDNDPYEVFTGENNDGEGDVIIPKSIKLGKLIKKARGKYVMYNEEREYSAIITNGHSDDNADALTRLISSGLRHGTAIHFIVEQLEKTKGDLTTFSKVLARTLKKYIEDGVEVNGELCPECKNKLVRQSGCVQCSNCSWTKCA